MWIKFICLCQVSLFMDLKIAEEGSVSPDLQTETDEQEGNILQGMRFLCAEDNEINAEILTELLNRNAGYWIVTNGRESDMKKTKRIVRNRRKMKGKRVIAGILLAEILAVTLAGCKNIDNTEKKQKSRSLHSAAITTHHTIIWMRMVYLRA